MVRIVDHSNRKKKVLAATVIAHIRNGEPVSSQELANDFGLSSATIRSILAELEEEGYLSHPHTSAGKVPSSQGYRYYVDFLMEESALSEEEKNTIIRQYYRNRSKSLDDILEATSDLVAEITHYATIVSSSQWQDKIFLRGLSNIIRQPEFKDVERLASVLRLLEEKRKLMEIINKELERPLKVYIGEEMGCPEISDSCSLVISTYSIGKKDKGRIAVLGPSRMSYEQTFSNLGFISATLTHLLEDF
ncbi:MAG: helix-turn-helix domain-containing protein [Candidatus Omnitrophota bacterium]|nr:helix-turn-helix domain-containing protein [Candidatus Omnitrophota bacterium]